MTIALHIYKNINDKQVNFLTILFITITINTIYKLKQSSNDYYYNCMTIL